ncbi:dimethylarginine dimethylaminohydrolase family protein [Alteribacillus sp. HJP-4]|uniref:dimethylarginine dimethylaminohydrolase family protein n=1 Tax=Alteribacillus sp. HJP-4 TaxID=2775394 RepID=UPI0035CD0859
MLTKKLGICRTEYGRLIEVLVCSPEEMRIEEVINRTQEKYEEIDQTKAVEEHNYFVLLLREHGVHVHYLKPSEKMPEQVFTRDLGFTSEQGIILGSMRTDIRRPETNRFEVWMEKNGWAYDQITNAPLEGGDVLLSGDTIYIGESSRTTSAAIEAVQGAFSDYQVVVLPFAKEYLHLDCVFNILSEDTALLFPDALSEEHVSVLENKFHIIRVKPEEQFYLGTNVLSIGEKKVCSLPENKRINEEMTARGFTVLPVPFSEIIKSGGSYRCCTFPLIRE